MTGQRDSGRPEETAAGAAVEPCCDELIDQLYEFMDSEINEETCHRFRGHLAECPPCRDAVAAEHRLRSMLRRSCLEVAPSQLRLRVVTQISLLRSRSD